MSKEHTLDEEYANAELAVRPVDSDADYDCYRDVPGFFPNLIRRALYSTDDFCEGGYEFAIHTPELLEASGLDDEDLDMRWEELRELVDVEDHIGVLHWYEREMPSCLALVPLIHTSHFIAGVILAADNELFDE